jgi:hypothetical protein
MGGAGLRARLAVVPKDLLDPDEGGRGGPPHPIKENAETD